MAVVLLARATSLLGPWWQGIWLSLPPALALPVVLLGAAVWDERIAAQLARPQALAAFLTTLFMIGLSTVLCVMGGHFAWLLRREAVETRSIGRYRLERRLGGGGMAEVWAAFDVTLRQHVALKTVSGNRPGSPLLLRLEREVRALAELTHPNTVRVFDYGVADDGLWYYAMELLHGVNLAELVAHEGPVPAERLLPIARQALRALGEAHDKRKTQASGWQIIGGIPWTRIVKLNAQGPTPNEKRNVLGLVLEAKRAGAQVIAFIRDSDGDRQRAAQIDAAIEKARRQFPDMEVVGNPAVPVLEAWLLALLGQTGTEKLTKSGAQSKLESKIQEKNTAAMVQFVMDAPLQRIPSDATRLKAWLVEAAAVLPK